MRFLITTKTSLFQDLHGNRRTSGFDRQHTYRSGPHRTRNERRPPVVTRANALRGIGTTSNNIAVNGNVYDRENKKKRKKRKKGADNDVVVATVGHGADGAAVGAGDAVL